MLSEDLIYEISTFLSPKALIITSLCSKYLRSIVMNNQRIWRTQYYKKWPAFFTPHNSTEDALFPALTWLQTFLMRKLSELNIERQKMREIPCNSKYRLFRDLLLHYDYSEKRMTIYKSPGYKVADLCGIDKFSTNYAKIRCKDDLLIVSSSCCGIHCLSMAGEYTYIDSEKMFSLFPIDKNRFVGRHHYGASLFTATADKKIYQQELTFPKCRIIVQVNRRPEQFISVVYDTETEKEFTWSMWSICNSELQLVMERKFIFGCKITNIREYSLADKNFIFIPFKTEAYVLVYVYSFKEDRSRIFEIKKREHEVKIAIFYALAHDSTASHNFYLSNVRVWVYFSGTTLESLSFISGQQDSLWTKFFIISRKLLLILSQNSQDICKVVDIHTGAVLWKKNVVCALSEADINSRYLVLNGDMYDFSPEEPPIVKEWLYKLFE